MAGQQLMSLAVALSVVQIISGYSFENCIEDANSTHTKFSCVIRKEKNISKIIGDLPHSATNLKISKNYIWHVPNSSFVHLPQLEILEMSLSHLSTVDGLAFQSLHCLKSLNLTSNNISELHPLLFRDLQNLTFLSLTNNRLKQLPVSIFADVTNLTTLILRLNLLANFSGVAQSVSHLKNLAVLDLCSNNLTSLAHVNSSLPKSLLRLYLCKNKLYTLGCAPTFLMYVRVLDLSYNFQLPSMAFKGLDLRQIIYLRMRSIRVNISELLSVSNIRASHIDFSGTDLNNSRSLVNLCGLLKTKVKWMKKLLLTDNKIEVLENHTLSRCPQITGALDLSLNRMKAVSCLSFLIGQRQIQTLNVEHNHLVYLKACNGQKTPPFQSLRELSFRYNRILSVKPHAFYHTPKITTLKLNINTIAFLDRKALKGLTHLETLRLDNNLLSDLFEDSFEDLYNLQTLNLRNNRIAVIFNGTFLNLTRLTTLDLGGNKITHFDPSGLDGLTSLANLYLDGNNLKEINSKQYYAFQTTLQVLDLQRNQIRFTSQGTSSPFMNLSKLRNLKLDGQRPHGITFLPHAFFRGLHALQSLYLTDNRIAYLATDAFDDLKGLRFLTLDNSCVGVVQLKPGVFKNLRNVSKLIVENMGIQNFSKEVFGNLTNLSVLQLNHNVMQTIAVEALEALPKLRYLDIRNTPLSCTCQNSNLQNWTVNNKDVQVVYLHSLPCQYSYKKFFNFDTNVCYLDLGKYLFFSTAAVIVLLTVIPIFYTKLYWKMKYGYYVFRSWFSEKWHRLREEEENCKYDAFISYNSSDEHWVLDQLLPNLEGNVSSFKLCLHHRDFELGRDIVDNIVSAVYSSRKTICVVSRNFLRSEWCSLEIQLASYRLFDEHRDVLLLVFLEPIPERQISSYHRMRKVMLKKTYLQWPDPECNDPAKAQDLFWNHLRKALRRGSRLEVEEELDRNEGCIIADREEKEPFVDQTPDEEYYLIP
ncbi:toll-like receptor 21 [Lampris incognitus]|uniref:toll-like receptor 21 n=1 Tax=Lampris incognitus TaxID=2546036 RepID=UPI0024B482E1|nr:toll-like receptor 21 [Lampris incognitus]